MRKTLLALLAFALFPLGSARSWTFQATSVTERRPNTVQENFYPRWLSWVGVSPEYTPTIQITNEATSGLSVAVDSRNFAHVVLASASSHFNLPSVFVISGFYIQIEYKNDHIESRLSNGFSDNVTLDSTQAQLADPGRTHEEYVSAPDICVDANDNIHAVWTHMYLYNHTFTSGGSLDWQKSADPQDHWEVLYRKKGPAGWGPTVTLTPAGVTRMKYANPRVAVGSDGVAHVVADRYDFSIDPLVTVPPRDSGSIRPLSSGISHFAYSGSGSPAIRDVTPHWPMGGGEPRLTIDGSNRVHLVWTESYVNLPLGAAGDSSLVAYSTFSGSGWGGRSVLAGGSAGTGSHSPDVAVDAAGIPAFVWTSGTVYETFGNFNYSGVGGAGVVGSTSGNGAVLIDSRGQPQVMWKVGGTLNYAARVKNPDPNTVSSTWQIQNPAIPAPAAASPSLHIRKAALSRNDQIHLVTERYYTKSMEYGLGARDGAAMVGLFPGGALNTTSGNLSYSLGLFQSAGVGPTQNLSLVYNALEPYAGGIAPGWKFNYEMYLIDHYLAADSNPGNPASFNSDEAVTVFLGDGRAVRFRFHSYNASDPASNFLVAEDEFGIFERMERTGWGNVFKEYKLITKQGVIFWFNVFGRLRQISDPALNYLQLIFVEFPDEDGNNIRVFYAITDTLGNAGGSRPSTLMGYESRTNQLYSPRPLIVQDPTGRQVQLGYSGNQLASVKFASTATTPIHSFEYSTSNNPATQERVNQLRRYLPPLGTIANPTYGWTCNYLPDGRLTRVQDPATDFLLDGDSDATLATSHVAVIAADYTETDPIAALKQVVITDRRLHTSLFKVEPRRSLALEIHGADFLLGAANVFPTIRTFDALGNLTQVSDRWGKMTQFVYHDVAVPPNVRDNLKEVWRPLATGPGMERVASFTYTVDGLNNLEDRSEYVTPTEIAGVQTRTTTHRYNQFGQLTRIEFPNVTRPDNSPQAGVFSTFEYNGPRRQLSRMVDEEGHDTVYSAFDPVHGLAQSVLQSGGTQSEEFIYDTMGNLFARNRPTGGFMNDAAGSTTFQRDGIYRLTFVTDPNGKVTSYGYDRDSNLTSTTPPVGGASTTTYDRRGFVSGGATPDGTWSQSVDASGNVRRNRDYRTFETNSTFDVLNRVTETRAPGGTSIPGGGGGGGPLIHTTRMSYDLSDGTYHQSLATQVGSPSNRETRTSFDNRGRPVRTLEPDLQTASETIYNQLDQPVAQQSLYANVVQSCSVMFRDQRNRVDHVRVQDSAYGVAPTNASHTYTMYNRTGAVLQTIDPLGSPSGGGFAHKMTYELDARDRVFRVTDGKGVVVRENHYGDDNLVAEVMVPDPVRKTGDLVRSVRYGYTSRKELRIAINARDEGSSYLYTDLQGQVSRVTDAIGRVTHTLYDSSTNRPTLVVEAEGSADQTTTAYTWTNGFLTQTSVFNPENGGNATHTNAYDAAGRLERIDYPTPGIGTPMAAERRTFDDFGQAKQTFTGGRTLSYTNNALGQLVQRSWSGTVSGTETRTYNGAGLPETVTNGSQSIVKTWNKWNGTPLAETFLVGGSPWKQQTRQTDVAGNQTGLTDPEGQAHGWPVDENNRPVQKKLGAQAVSQVAYTPGGLVDSETLQNASGIPIAKVTHLYDDVGRRIQSVTATLGTGEVQSDYGYEHNAAGEVTKIVPNHLGMEFSTLSDFKGRLASQVTPGNASGTAVPPYTNQLGGTPTGNEGPASAEVKGIPHTILPVLPRSATYTYNAGGNRASQTVNGVVTMYVYNALNQLQTETSQTQTVTHSYDELGNETQRVTAINGGGTTTEAFGYNERNLMSAYTNTGTGASWQYDYWPEGERYGKTNLGLSTSELYVPKDGDVVTEYAKAGAGAPTLKNTYVQGLGIDSKTMRLQAGTLTRRHYLGDAVGTLTGTLDEAGVLAETSVKDAWGQTLAGATAETSAERYGFAQRENDTESGLVYMRNRMYDPRTGRFTQGDPILGNRPSKHYTYAGNSPVSRRDPTGLYEEDVHFYMTYYLAQKVGFSRLDAYKIAGTTQYVDDDSRTVANLFGPQVQLTLHFAQKPTGTTHKGPGKNPTTYRDFDPVVRNNREANMIFDTAVKEGDLIKAGFGLHILEDSYAHEGYQYGFGHFWASAFGQSPDVPQRNPEKALQMSRRVVQRLCELAVSVGICPNWGAYEDSADKLRRLFSEKTYNSRSTESLSVRVAMWRDFLSEELGDDEVYSAEEFKLNYDSRANPLFTNAFKSIPQVDDVVRN